jgi:hypothetical protein
VSTDQRPAEGAARQHTEDEAALAVSQMTGEGGHTAAVMAPFPGVAVTDRTDPRVTGPSQMDLPAAPDAGSKHTGPPGP